MIFLHGLRVIFDIEFKKFLKNLFSIQKVLGQKETRAENWLIDSLDPQSLSQILLRSK